MAEISVLINKTKSTEGREGLAKHSSSINQVYTVGSDNFMWKYIFNPWIRQNVDLQTF